MTRRPKQNEEWFRQKIRELADALRDLPIDRQEAAADALEDGELEDKEREQVQ